MFVMVLGESGTGKTYAVRNLDPEKTFYMSATNKGMTFRGWRKKYTPIVGNDGKRSEDGNYYTTKNAKNIFAAIKKIDEARPDINTIVIDDFQYFLVDMFMNKPENAKGNAVFETYNMIGKRAYEILTAADETRDDLVVFVMAHTAVDDSGTVRMKTIGKLIDEKITPEGLCNIVLGTKVVRENEDTEYLFETQNNGYNTLKSPYGMLPPTMPNDLAEVRKAIYAYENGDEYTPGEQQ